MKKFELVQGKLLRKLLEYINPFKKLIITTECEVHVFNNIQALEVLRKFNYSKEYNLLNDYLSFINKGSIWADQDFRSINHFYSPNKKRGLFGHSNALNLASDYYDKASYFWRINDKDLSMFYLGACVHVIQDVTIPQHVTIRLLSKHRHYENFVKYTYDLISEYKATEKPIFLKSPEEYIQYNAKRAYYVGWKLRPLEDDKLRFHKQTLYSLPLAQRTTAGVFLMFLNAHPQK
ncbi:zinc dependent phospholipase C family protein [Vallitalea okinawensis]|uniref:zinc dependent phospholipase C family protein n=1 Tax=Vallitalea okinawensis TaxID=2078660 RepID=UPI000CFB433A|nr:zinc dependent phospholipase C family protein [Vallitalea okinawensis]